jgi:ribosomal protein L37E
MTICETCGYDFQQHLRLRETIDELRQRLAAAEAQLRQVQRCIVCGNTSFGYESKEASSG